MRRKDRLITDHSEIKAFLENEQVIRIALTDDKGIYIVPLNYGLEWDDESPVFYFHGATEGRKAEIIKQGPLTVSFEIDGSHAPDVGEGCASSYKYMSVMGTATLEELKDDAEKRAALDAIMLHFGGQPIEYPEAVVNHTMACRLTVTELSAKANK